nr:hypothetical protein [uncultured Dysosmobacter sp.]
MEIEQAIRISKVICMAPEERLPMILSVLEKADVSISGLEELEEWKALKDQAYLIDIEDFRNGIVAEFGRDAEAPLINIPAKEFNRYCAERNLKPSCARRALAKYGIIQTGQQGSRLEYTQPVRINGEVTRCVVVFRYGEIKRGAMNDESKR